MFKVTVMQIDKDAEQEIVVRCHAIDSEVVAIVEKLQQSEAMTLGIRDGKTYQIPVRDIFYIESVDSKTYIYLEQDVYETKLRLYEFEEKFRGTKLFRCSKGMILNIGKVKAVSPSVNSRFVAKLTNGEAVIISRQYVKNLKKLLGM